jgi:hypothetical protein
MSSNFLRTSPGVLSSSSAMAFCFAEGACKGGCQIKQHYIYGLRDSSLHTCNLPSIHKIAIKQGLPCVHKPLSMPSWYPCSKENTHPHTRTHKGTPSHKDTQGHTKAHPHTRTHKDTQHDNEKRVVHNMTRYVAIYASGGI